ncbi:basic proline-rich protein [Triticum aestivum]|uniref:basic proline-rich protein n=1 Tax=Triticum aestivum TaxID=4565 RepID=UPI001D008E8C|nr:basic proline-rich protein-like [Triticum aestivum]
MAGAARSPTHSRIPCLRLDPGDGEPPTFSPVWIPATPRSHLLPGLIPAPRSPPPSSRRRPAPTFFPAPCPPPPSSRCRARPPPSSRRRARPPPSSRRRARPHLLPRATAPPHLPCIAVHRLPPRTDGRRIPPPHRRTPHPFPAPTAVVSLPVQTAAASSSRSWPPQAPPGRQPPPRLPPPFSLTLGRQPSFFHERDTSIHGRPTSLVPFADRHPCRTIFSARKPTWTSLTAFAPFSAPTAPSFAIDTSIDMY